MAGDDDKGKRTRSSDADYITYGRTKRTVTRRNLPRGTLQIADEVMEETEEQEETSGDDEEEEDYQPSPRHTTRGKGKEAASSRSSRGAAGQGPPVFDDESVEENEEFLVDVPVPQMQMNFGALLFREPVNPPWREKVNYKGKTDLVRQMRVQDPRQINKEASDYRFHTYFQQDYYESVIVKKSTPVAVSQWIDWRYISAKKDPILDQVTASCRARNVSAIMGLYKDWNNEVIAQFYATLYIEEHDDVRKLHWMTEGRWYEVSYAQFARILGFGRLDANRPRLHYATRLELRRMEHMYPRSKAKKNAGTVTDLYPFYAYLNRMLRKTLALREGDVSKIPGHTRNILAAMAPSSSRGFPFSVFDFIWEEIKVIANHSLKSCAYAPYVMLMIETVTGGTFVCEMEHKPFRIKNTLKNPVEDSEETAPTHDTSSFRGGNGSGQRREKSTSPIRKFFNFFLGMCRSQYDADVRAHHERQERKKNTITMKKLHEKENLQPPRSPIGSEAEESPPMGPFDERMHGYQAQNLSAQYFDNQSFQSFGFGDFGAYYQQQPPTFDEGPSGQAHHDEQREEEEEAGQEEEEEDDGDEDDDE